VQLVSHYVRLRSCFADAREGESISVSLQQLADILCCTVRNANFILKRLSDLQWIRWSAGRGRGNLSKLAFLVPEDALFMELAKERVQKGEIRQALELLNRESVSAEVRQQFVEWLNGHFGHRSEASEESQVDMLRFPTSKKSWVLDPAFALFANETHMTRQIFDCLVQYNPKTRQMEPQLAHNWEMNEQHTEWTFYLRKGVLFHHRKAMTACDVAFSLRRIMDEQVQSPYQWLFAQIQDIQVHGKHRLTITLTDSNPLFLHLLGAHPASIVPEEMVRKRGPDFAHRPVGTGPFQVTRHDETTLLLEAFSAYFQPRAHLDRLEIWKITELDDLYPPEYPDHSFQLRYLFSHTQAGISPDWREAERLQAGSRFLCVNLAKPGPQQHPAFRQALHHGINRENLTEDCDNLLLADCLFPEFEQEGSGPLYKPEMARKLLAEAGYQGETLRLCAFSQYQPFALLVQEQCEDLGISVEITLQPSEEAASMAQFLQADIAICDVVFDDDPVVAFLDFFNTPNSYVRAYLNSPLLEEMERRLAEIPRAAQKALHVEKLRQLEQWLIEQGVILHLNRRRQKTYYHPALKGVTLCSFGWVDFRQIWFQSC